MCFHYPVYIIVFLAAFVNDIFVHCHELTEPFMFRIESNIEWVWRSMSPDRLRISGPRIPSNEHYLVALCTAAKNYAQVDTKHENRQPVSLEPGRVEYCDRVSHYEQLHVLWCNMIPEIWIRADDNGVHVIMMQYSDFVSDEKFNFDVKKIQSDPEPISGGGDNPLQRYFGQIEALHICWNAKKHVGFVLPTLHSLTVSGDFFEFRYDDNNTEIHAAFKCPSLPIMYVYFGNSETDIKVFVVTPSFRTLRSRKSENPRRHVIKTEN